MILTKAPVLSLIMAFNWRRCCFVGVVVVVVVIISVVMDIMVGC